MALDKYGFPQGIRTPGMLQDLESAAQELQSLIPQWQKDGFNIETIKELSTNFERNQMIAGIKNRVAAATSPESIRTGLATIEGEAAHIISAAQVQLEKAFQEKIPLAKPGEEVQSAIKGMQITIDNLSSKINESLQSLGNFADAASMPSMDMESMIQEAASINSKYMKTIFNKMNEFTNKKLNAELSKTIAHLPASKRSMFADMKKVINQDMLKQYSGIGNDIGGLLSGVLSESLNVNSLVEQAMNMASNPITPSINSLFKDWVPNMVVEAGEKIRFRNNVYTVGKSGKTGTTLPDPNIEIQQSGNTTLSFDTFATGDSSDGNETLYGDVRTHPTVPVCYAENVMGQAISGSKDLIDQANNNIINSMNAFIGDIQVELEDAQQKAKPKARDASDDGKVLSITDEEGLGNNQGGSYYVTTENAGTLNGGSVLNRGVGIASTAPGGGVGLTVDITVTKGGATGTTDGETWIKLLTGGSGYNDGGTPSSDDGTNSNQNTTGGLGSGCKANITYVSGVGTKVTITECQGGKDYEKGDVLSIVGANGGSGCTFEIIKPRGRIDQFGMIINNPGRGYEIGELLTVDRETYCSTAPDASFTATQTTDPGQVTMEAPKEGKNKPQSLGGILSMLGGLGGSLSSALDFKNIAGNVFPFELPPNPAVSDFFTLADGGGGMPDGQLPSLTSLAQGAIKNPLKDGLDIAEKLPFAQPLKDIANLSNVSNITDQLQENIGELQENLGDTLDYLG